MRLAACVIAAGLSLASVLPTAAGPGVRDRGVAWLFFIDDLHIDFRTTGIVRAWLLSLLDELIRENDVFAAQTTGPSRVSVGWLAGVPDLEHGIRRVAGSALKQQEIQQSPAGSDEVAYRARVSLRAATEFMATAPRHDSRRRVMLYVGKGFAAAEAVVDETQRFLTEAWRLDVTLIAIDAGALPGVQRIVAHTRGNLEALALPTQGLVLADDASVRQAAVVISNAIRDPR